MLSVSFYNSTVFTLSYERYQNTVKEEGFNMPVVNRAKTTTGRAEFAIGVLKKNLPFDRDFDSCFEMGDSDQVMNYIIKRARIDKELALAIQERLPTLGSDNSNVRLQAAIKECLEVQNDLFSSTEEFL